MICVYESKDYKIELLDRKGKVYYKNKLGFIGDTRIAISMFLRHSTDTDINLKLKRRIRKGA